MLAPEEPLGSGEDQALRFTPQDVVDPHLPALGRARRPVDRLGGPASRGRRSSDGASGTGAGSASASTSFGAGNSTPAPSPSRTIDSARSVRPARSSARARVSM